MDFFVGVYNEVADWAVTHIGVLFPAGSIAAAERDLMVAATLLMLVVVLPVFVMTAMIAFRYRESNTKARFMPNWDHNLVHELIWWGVPIAIISILAVVTWKSTHALDPYKAIESEREPIIIQTISLNWKWLFLYPEEGIATTNTITLPEDTPVIFRITSDAPMNAIWMPELSGMIMTMQGMITELNIIVPETGVYRGMSSNYSGDGFSDMDFSIHVVEQTEYNEWAQRIRRNESAFTLMTYKEFAKNWSTEPEAAYRLEAPNLFRSVVMRYMMPKVGGGKEMDAHEIEMMGMEHMMHGM